jgi:pimeloyl-ACP methyl ester carboxylesterase
VDNDIRNSDTIILEDGRRLAWSEYGDSSGVPILYFHGWPGSRLEASIYDARRLAGFHLYSLDRPGMGLSDLQPLRRIGDWPKDVAAFTEIMGLSRFSILGVSGGGPYALACASSNLRGLVRVGVVGGVGPINSSLDLGGSAWWNRLLFQTYSRHPGFARRVFHFAASIISRRPLLCLKIFKRSLPPEDREVLERGRIKNRLPELIREPFRRGPLGVSLDGELYCQAWNFRLEDTRFPVFLWHGKKDRNVPYQMSVALSEKIPESKLKLFSNQGHLSLPISQIETILTTIEPD